MIIADDCGTIRRIGAASQKTDIFSHYFVDELMGTGTITFSFTVRKTTEELNN